MSVSVWRDDSAAGVTHEVDVAIVGGGIAGLAIARQCAIRGLVPAVIEARDLAAGATGRNAGFAMTGLAEHYEDLVRAHGRDRARAAWEASRRNLRELVDDVAGREGVACDLVPCGSVIAAWTDDEASRLERSYALLREDGFGSVALLGGRVLAERLGSTRFAAGMFVPEDHGVHPVKLVRALAARVRDAGGLLLEQHEVSRIDDDAPGGRVRVQTSRGVVRASRVVLATNAYSRMLDAWFEPLVRPVRGQVLATAPAPATLRALLYTDDGFQYARQLPDGRLVAGGWRRDHAEAEVGYGDETTPAVQAGIEGFVRESWPELARVEVTHRWSGVMGFSPDGLPLVGTLPHRPRVAFAVGFTGHGLGFALVAARAALDVVTGQGDGPGIFDAARFGDAPSHAHRTVHAAGHGPAL
jgi:gamma-glutamylputrescine oxidase